MNKDQIKMGYVKYNLDSHEGQEAMKIALDSERIKMLIDTLYDDVFRPVLKYEEVDIRRDCFEEIWDKVFKHFNA